MLIIAEFQKILDFFTEYFSIVFQYPIVKIMLTTPPHPVLYAAAHQGGPEAPPPARPDLKPETRNQKPETRNQKPETRNHKPETRNHKKET
jgi:hypothetical protein